MNILLSTFLDILERDGKLPPPSTLNTAAFRKKTHGQAEQAEDNAEARQAEVLSAVRKGGGL